MMEGKWGTTPWEETSTHCGRQIKYTFAAYECIDQQK
jgi:hypothetical protein